MFSIVELSSLLSLRCEAEKFIFEPVA